MTILATMLQKVPVIVFETIPLVISRIQKRRHKFTIVTFAFLHPKSVRTFEYFFRPVVQVQCFAKFTKAEFCKLILVKPCFQRLKIGGTI